MKTFIVPDLHGNYKTLKALLREAGILDNQNKRVNDDIKVVSLGDLANCVATDVHKDLKCLSKVGDWIDVLLIGNHEHPYFGGPAFNGFARYPEIAAELNRIDREGMLQPAELVGDILITHAGYVPTVDIESAADGYAYALECWAEDRRHPLFSTISMYRGGRSAKGGILWSDWSEKKAHEFNQIVGHTPQKRGVQRRDYESTGKWSINIDCGAKNGEKVATGALIEDGEVSFVTSPELVKA